MCPLEDFNALIQLAFLQCDVEARFIALLPGAIAHLKTSGWRVGDMFAKAASTYGTFAARELQAGNFLSDVCQHPALVPQQVRTAVQRAVGVVPGAEDFAPEGESSVR